MRLSRRKPDESGHYELDRTLLGKGLLERDACLGKVWIDS